MYMYMLCQSYNYLDMYMYILHLCVCVCVRACVCVCVCLCQLLRSCPGCAAGRTSSRYSFRGGPAVSAASARSTTAA